MSKDEGDEKEANQHKMPDTGYSLTQQQHSYLLLTTKHKQRISRTLALLTQTMQTCKFPNCNYLPHELRKTETSICQSASLIQRSKFHLAFRPAQAYTQSNPSPNTLPLTRKYLRLLNWKGKNL